MVHNYFIGGYMDKQRGIEQAEEALETLAQTVDRAEAIFAKAVQFGKRAFVLADEFLDNLDSEIKKVKTEETTAPPKGATGAGTEDKAGTDNKPYDRVRDLLFIQGYMLEKWGYEYCKNTVWFNSPHLIDDQRVAATKYVLEDYEKNKAQSN